VSRQVVLVRHAETEWSKSGQHTGTTDLPLLEEGRRKAELLRAPLAESKAALVLTSPLRRARDTCEIAGHGDRAVLRPELVEWDYGSYEGLTTEQIRREQPGWDLWRDGAPGGESPRQVQSRLDPLVAELQAGSADEGDVLVFAHGHVLQALALRWVGVEITGGPLFELSTGSISRLGWKRESPVIETWNDRCHLKEQHL
jgi:broad specificity phosphatase PhoE